MKQNIFIRMLGAMAFAIFFAHGHASRCCVPNPPKPASRVITGNPALHFGPLEMIKW